MNIDNVLKWILAVASISISIVVSITTILLLLFPKHERQGHHVQQPRQCHDARDDKARGILRFGRGQGTRQPIETQTRHDLAERDNGTPKGNTNEDTPIASAVLPCCMYNTKASKRNVLDLDKQTNKPHSNNTLASQLAI